VTTRAFLRERLRSSDAVAMMPGGASVAHVFGTVLVVLLGMQALTGAGLAAFYSPSTTDAWASVAYVQDQAWLGWLVRGLHAHGASALVIISGLHLVQTAVAGAYKRPRELVWWLGVLLLVLVIVWAVTGYVLRWDQAGYWANQVEIRIAASSPVIGELIRTIALGGNDYGNLTLTRFYALHVIALPALVLVVTVVHVRLSRRHGPTAVRDAPAVPRWPHQSLRDVVAVAIVLSVLPAYVVPQHGVDLASPPDPTPAVDPPQEQRRHHQAGDRRPDVDERADATAPLAEEKEHRRGHQRQEDGHHHEVRSQGAHPSSLEPSTWSVPPRPREASSTTRNSAVVAKPITIAVSPSHCGMGSV